MGEQQAAQFLHGFSALGVPLLAAIQEIESWEDTSDVPAADRLATTAARFNALLTAAMVLSSRIANQMGISDDATPNGLRLKVAEQAVRLIANHYRFEGNIPDEAALNALLSTNDPLLSIAESILPAKLPAETENFALVEVMEALFPLQLALSKFAFGEDARTFGQRLAGRLNTYVDGMLTDLKTKVPSSGDLEDTRRRSEIFKGCARLLTSSVEIEQNNTSYNESVPDIAEVQGRIWEHFESNLALLRQMLGFMFGITDEETETSRSSGSSSRNVKPQAVKTEPDKKANPMSFFVKKPAGGMGK